MTFKLFSTCIFYILSTIREVDNYKVNMAEFALLLLLVGGSVVITTQCYSVAE